MFSNMYIYSKLLSNVRNVEGVMRCTNGYGVDTVKNLLTSLAHKLEAAGLVNAASVIKQGLNFSSSLDDFRGELAWVRYDLHTLQDREPSKVTE